MSTPAHVRIDFVSDVACPWCMIGLASLTTALARLDGSVAADIHLQPFELEPSMPYAGQDAVEHIMQKYGITEAQSEANRKALRERAEALGVAYNVKRGSRVWNTFDAHRLLHWAELQDPAKAIALKRALFHAYFADNQNVADHAVLERLATDCDLDATAARTLLEGDQYADEVRDKERYYQQAGIHSVPATIVNGKHLIPGGQPPEVFEAALRDLAGKEVAA